MNDTMTDTSNETSYEEFDLVLEEILQSYKLTAKKIYLGAIEGRKISSADMNELTRVNDQITFVRHLMTLRKIGRTPLEEGLETIKEYYQNHNDDNYGEANVALCERLILTFAPCEVRRNIHIEV